MIKTDDITSKEIEPAKTGRSKCKFCNSIIEKNSLRIGISYSESGVKWHHLACFPLKDIITSPDELEGYTTLNEEEQNLVKDQMNVVIGPIRSASGDKFIDPPNLEQMGEEEKNEISAIKSKIEEYKTVTAEKLREMLVENSQYSAGVKGELLVRSADVIVRGSIPKCKTCEKGFLFWSESTQDYFCKGYINEEGNAVKCEAVFPKEEIKRTPTTIPDNLFQKKERKRKVTVTTVIEQVEDKKEQEEEEEEDNGMRKRRKSAGIRKWNDDFIYEKDDSEENSVHQDDHEQEQPNDNQNEQIHQNQPTPSNYFNTVINYNNGNGNDEYYPNDDNNN